MKTLVMVQMLFLLLACALDELTAPAADGGNVVRAETTALER
jgi:hypothetical protein